MPSTVTDLRYGRRGGGWLPIGYTPPDEEHAAHCDVCGEPLLAGQAKRHASCQPGSNEMFPDA